MKQSGVETPTIGVKHISIRVPWHDAGWNGTVCNNPKANGSCLALGRIRETRKDNLETEKHGWVLTDLPDEEWPACAGERGSFMSPFSFTRVVGHPYAKTSEHHAHILPTPIHHPPYSAAAIPFRWMNKEFAWSLAQDFQLDASPDREPNDPEWLAKRPWVQAKENQKVLLEGFFKGFQSGESLCFFYAKHTPLVEDDRRVLIGVGRVLKVGKPTEYRYSSKKAIGSYLWDVIVEHSIRPDFKDGFLLPYHSVLAEAAEDPKIDPAEFVAFAPEDRREEFSYASEQVSHDAAIAALLSCKGALDKASDLVDEPCDRGRKWIDARLSEIWKLRGPFPGLGAALTAFGFEHGNILAYHLAAQMGENEDPWPLVEKVIENPSTLPKPLRSQLNDTLRAKWRTLLKKKPDRLSLLNLLARFELTNQQAIRFFVPEVRSHAGIECTDSQLLENPYLIYEFDRFAGSGNDEEWPEHVSVWTIDRGLFPDPVIRKNHPVPSPSGLDGATDPRRVRAFTVEQLEQAANQGHTLLPRDKVIQQIRGLGIEPSCPVDGDLYDVIIDSLAPAVKTCSLAKGSPAFQLDRLEDMGSIIRTTIEKKLHVKRHEVKVDWAARLANPELLGPVPKGDENESRARIEKTSALKELISSRFSVLIGPAGTGKTTVLAALCQEPVVSKNGVLLLAPTGKARVRLWQACKQPAKTLAQFLMEHGRYDSITGRYLRSDEEKFDGAKTIIVDEASMLTEEQLGALLDSLKGVDRLILGGDPRQLPPIGAGRPFVDIVKSLTPENIEVCFPRVGPGYAELSIRRRQKGEDPVDLQLADWFSGKPLEPGEDEIWYRITLGEDLGRLRLVAWQDAEDLREKILQVLSEELHLADQNDRRNFELSLGGTEVGKYVYFNKGSAEKAEAWQVLTPFRNLIFGSRDMNRLIQRSFRQGALDWARDSNQPPFWRKMPRITKARGPEEIVYGDKIINIRNHRRKDVDPKGQALCYVANGEIGMVVGQFKAMNATWSGLPWLTKVEFSSQCGFVYDYRRKDFDEEGIPLLELAYAVTVHKAQGSEFQLTIFILPQPCRLMSREMLYTALTRQRERVVVLYQGNATDLRQYASPKASETARRLTNLFSNPIPIRVDDVFLEEGLIHCSSKGTPMRSKSEVIIADALTDKGVDYDYELPFIGSDGQVRYPDFTVEDAESGITYLWEHCGLLNDESYLRRWESKLAWYREQGVLPREEGTGSRATLIITKDTPKGGIKSQEIHSIIKEIWG